MEIKTNIQIGDIVRANNGSVVFGFTNTETGERSHSNIPPFGVVVSKITNKQTRENEFKVKIIFDENSFATYKAEDLTVICSTGLKDSGVCISTLEQIKKIYSTSEVVMGEMLAGIPANGLSITEAVNLYLKAMNWAEDDHFFRKYDDGKMEKVEEV